MAPATSTAALASPPRLPPALQSTPPAGRRRQPWRRPLLTATAALMAVVSLVGIRPQPTHGSGGPPIFMIDDEIGQSWVGAQMAADGPDLARCLTQIARAHTYGFVFRHTNLPGYYWGADFDLAMNIDAGTEIAIDDAWEHRQAALLYLNKALRIDPTNPLIWKARGFVYAESAKTFLTDDFLPPATPAPMAAEVTAELARLEALVRQLNAVALADRRAVGQALTEAGKAAEPVLLRHLKDPVLEIRRAAFDLLRRSWREQAIYDSLRAWQVHCEKAATAIDPSSEGYAERFKSEAGLNYLRLLRERGVRDDERALAAQVKATLSPDALIRLDPPPPTPEPARD